MAKNLELEQECIYSIIGVYNLLLKNLEKVFKPYNISASKFNILMVIKPENLDLTIIMCASFMIQKEFI